MTAQAARGTRWIRGAALLVAVAALLACSPQTRHRVLNFFFDGVPEPGAARPPSWPHEIVVGPVPIPAESPTIPPSYRSAHEPYVRRECDQCHLVEQSQTPVALDQTLCLRCHGARVLSEGWDHGPLNFGLCRVCHNPHMSPHLHLQNQAQPDLCFHCHTDSTLMTGIDAHVGEEEQRCTACHDPHRMGVYVTAAVEEEAP